ncbi:hypothetical protein AAFF_G00338210 [Aldrovandia affinis]|uniref:Uncharacterized protein n=1 Tax=Aldrovandia affinis TaxID=143900 RepID=A0AAD7SKZ5_9TELE|nr:hypothetical protein AAFF_G00338210 [Aldrovandia affinis]
MGSGKGKVHVRVTSSECSESSLAVFGRSLVEKSCETVLASYDVDGQNYRRTASWSESSSCGDGSPVTTCAGAQSYGKATISVCVHEVQEEEEDSSLFLGTVAAGGDPWMVDLKISDRKKGRQQIHEDVHVIRNLHTALLGRPAITKLELVARLDTVDLGTLKDSYPNLCSGLGLIQQPYTIKLKPGAEPFSLKTPR